MHRSGIEDGAVLLALCLHGSDDPQLRSISSKVGGRTGLELLFHSAPSQHVRP